MGGTLSLGVDGGWQRHSYDMINTPPPSPMDPSPDMVVHRSLSRWDADAGAWIEQSWFVANDAIEIRPGVRGDHFGLSDQWTLDPRIAIREELPHGLVLTQSLGRYHAPPLVTDFDPIFGDRVMLGSSATQVALGGKAIVGDDKEVSATITRSREAPRRRDQLGHADVRERRHRVRWSARHQPRGLVDTQFGSYSYREAIGSGHAYGLELIARKNLGRWTGWIAYTYGRSYRKRRSRTTRCIRTCSTSALADALIGSTALGKRWRIGGRMRYTTGNPMTPVAAAYLDGSGDWVAVDGPLLSRRLPTSSSSICAWIDRGRARGGRGTSTSISRTSSTARTPKA